MVFIKCLLKVTLFNLDSNPAVLEMRTLGGPVPSRGSLLQRPGELAFEPRWLCPQSSGPAHTGYSLSWRLVLGGAGGVHTDSSSMRPDLAHPLLRRRVRGERSGGSLLTKQLPGSRATARKQRQRWNSGISAFLSVAPFHRLNFKFLKLRAYFLDQINPYSALSTACPSPTPPSALSWPTSKE